MTQGGLVSFLKPEEEEEGWSSGSARLCMRLLAMIIGWLQWGLCDALIWVIMLISYFIYKYVWLFKNIPKKKISSIVCSLLLHRLPFFLAKFVEPWTGRREGSGGENAGMWGSDITGRYITASQVHCQAAPGLCATHVSVVLSPTRMCVDRRYWANKYWVISVIFPLSFTKTELS